MIKSSQNISTKEIFYLYIKISRVEYRSYIVTSENYQFHITTFTVFRYKFILYLICVLHFFQKKRV